MCDIYCSIMKDSFTAPQDCMSDSDCPDGVDIMVIVFGDSVE